MLNFDIAIIGGGFAGIVYALEYKIRYPSARIIILERERVIGGLLRTEEINGFVFDIGGSHIIFSRNIDILNRLLGFLNNDVVELTRKAFVRLDDKFVPYPIEVNLDVFPTKERADILISLIETLVEKGKGKRPKNLREWIYSFFGRWMAEKYLIPYNIKIWKRSLEEIDIDWVYIPGRLPFPNWREIVRSAIGEKITGYREQSRFYYPKKGGIQKLFDSIMKLVLERDVKYVSSYLVREIKKFDDCWIINNEILARKIVNSIPLKEFVEIVDTPETIKKKARKLEYNSLLTIGVALNKEAPDQHWIYVPEEDIIFHRYSWICNYSPYNAPMGKSSLLMEITFHPDTRIIKEEVEERAVEDLKKLEIIKNETEVIFKRSWIIKYAYPVHTIKSNRARDEILEWFRENDVTLIGRWGLWQYWNLDKVYENVLETLG